MKTLKRLRFNFPKYVGPTMTTIEIIKESKMMTIHVRHCERNRLQLLFYSWAPRGYGNPIRVITP